MLLSSVAAYRVLIGTNLAAAKVNIQIINEKMQKGFGPSEESQIIVTKRSNQVSKRKSSKSSADQKSKKVKS